MATAFGICKSIYRSLLPQSLRHRLYTMTPLSLQRIRSRALTRLDSIASHDEIYDREYYAKSVEPGMRQSADIIADSIVTILAPKTVVDVGCGTGGLMLALSARGVRCIGLEYAQAGIDICTQRGLDVRKFDLESAERFDQTADVVVSTEVAEHLPACVADRYVDLLCATAPVVVMTAATPDGPVGTDHVNEQPTEYWVEKFTARGFRFDETTALQWRGDWRERGASSIYYNTALVFRRSNQPAGGTS